MRSKGVHPEKLALAKRLLLLRAANGWTQAFAAKMIGENQATWGWWESRTNPRTPTAEQLVQIEIATGAPREWVQSGIAVRMPKILEQRLFANPNSKKVKWGRLTKDETQMGADDDLAERDGQD